MFTRMHFQDLKTLTAIVIAALIFEDSLRLSSLSHSQETLVCRSQG